MKRKCYIIEELPFANIECECLGQLGYTFEYEKTRFLFSKSHSSPQYVRLVLPIDFIITDENRAQAAQAMSYANSRIMYAKVHFVGQKSVWASYEHHLQIFDNGDMFRHMMKTLYLIKSEFLRIMNHPEGNFSDDLDEDTLLQLEFEKFLESEASQSDRKPKRKAFAWADNPSHVLKSIQ